MKDHKSIQQTDEEDFVDESVEPNMGSKRVTLHSVREDAPSRGKSLKQSASNESYKIFGTMRYPTTLSSSLKDRQHSPQEVAGNRPIFLTSFKTMDNKTLRMKIAKAEPNLDSYNPPKLHQFRNDIAPEDKSPFMVIKIRRKKDD